MATVSLIPAHRLLSNVLSLLAELCMRGVCASSVETALTLVDSAMGTLLLGFGFIAWILVMSLVTQEES